MEYNTFDDIIKVLKSDNNEQSQQAQPQPQEQSKTMVAENEPKWFDNNEEKSQDNAQASASGASETNSNNAESTNAGLQVVNDGRQVVNDGQQVVNDGQQDLYDALDNRQSFADYVSDNAKRITMYDDAENNPYSNYTDEELAKDSNMIRFLASTAQQGTPARNRVDRYIEEVNKRNNTKQLAPAQKNKDGYYLYNPSNADEEENEFLNLNNEQLQKQAEETKKSLDAMSADSNDYAPTYKKFEKILYAINMRDYSNKNNEPMKRYNQQVKAYNDAIANQRAKQNNEANTAAKGLQNWLNSHDVSKDINAEAYASTSWRNGAIDTENMSEQEAIVQAWNYVNGDTATADKINYVRGVMSNLEARKKGDKNAQTLVAKMLGGQQGTLQEYRQIRGSEKTASGKNKYIDDAEKQALLSFKQNAEKAEKSNEAQAQSEYDASLGNVSYFDDGNEFARMKYASQVLTGVDYAKLAVNAWESIPENKRNAMILAIAEDRGDLTEQGINKVADEVSSKFMQDCFNAIKADIPEAMVGTIQNALSNSIVGTLTQGVLRSMNPNAGEVTYQSLIAEKQADWAKKNTFGMISSTALQMVLDAPAFSVLGKGANIATKTIAKPILNRAVAGRWILPRQFSNSIYNTFAMTKSGQLALGVTQGAFLGAMFSPIQLGTQSFATGKTFSVGDYLSTAATGALHFGAMGFTPFISNGMSKWWGNKFSGTGKVSTIFNSAGQVAIHDLISPGINATLVTTIENVGDICSKGISGDLLTEWARTYGEFLGFHIGGKVAHITRGNLIKNLRSMYGHQTQLSRSVFTDSELKALRNSEAVKEIQRIIRENEQLDDATMNKIAGQHKLIIEDASIPEAVKMKLFAAIGNSAIATPTIADCRIEKDGKYGTVSIYTADGKLFSQERYTSAKAAQNEKQRIDGYIKVNNINMLEGAYNQVWYSAINSDAIETMSRETGNDANTIVERLDAITRKRQSGERLSEEENSFVKSFGEFFKEAQKRNENAETDRILNASDVKNAFKKLDKDIDAILAKMPFEWSEAEAEVIDRYTRRMQSDVDRFNSEIKDNNEKQEIAGELDNISEQSYNTTDAESMNALLIELNIATAEAEKEFGGATLQEILDNPVEAIQRINTSKDYTDAQREKLNELCRLQVRMNAMVRRVNDDINNELEQSRQAIEQVTNKQTDEVIEVELTPKAGVKEGTKVYVINGQLHTYGEGVVDYDKSDKSIAIYIEGEGKKMVPPSQIVRVVSRQSAEEAINAQAQEIISRHSAEADAKFNATIPAQVGYKFPVLLGGEERELEIVEQRDKNGNPIPPKEGNVFVNDNGNVIEMPLDELTTMANNLKAQRIAEERAKRYPAQEVKEAEETDTAFNESEPEPEQKAQEPSPKEIEIEPKENAPEEKEEALEPEPKEPEPKPKPKVNEPEQKDEASSPKYERGEVVLNIDGEDKIGYINGKKGELYEYYVQGEDNFRYATEKELDSIVKEYTQDKREDVLDKELIDALEKLTEPKETDSIVERAETPKEDGEKYQLADEQGKDIQQMLKEQEADAINPDIEEKQRVQELTEDEKSSMKAIADHLGVDLIFEDNAPYNGVYRTIDEETKKPTIRISRRATNPLDSVFGHEILHRLRKVSSDAYNEILTAVRVIMGDDAFYNEAYSLKRLYAENKENPVAISDKAAGEEVVANFVGSLIHDKAHLSKLVYKLSHPVLSSIRDAFSEFLNYFRRGGLSYDAAMAKGALRMIDRAFADVATNKFPFEIEEGTKYSLIVDQNEIDRLNKEKVETGYQNIELKDDLSVGSPMASKLKNTGKGKIATGDSQFGRWGVSEENPDLVDENGKIDLLKPDGKTVPKVDYNPYFHIRPYLFNKQFKQAWERPKLVFIETEFPASELTSGFKAYKAKLTTGRHSWNGGDLILSRWTRPKAIVPWREVAPHWIEEFKDSGVHFDNVPPALLNVLRDNGVKILPPHKGMGANCFEAYESFKKGNYNPEFITDEQIDAFNENIKEKRAESEDDAKYSLIRNGKEYRNNGYTQREDGTNISVRANEAEEEGSFSKGNFVKRYGIAKKDFDTLGDIGIIEQNEWHHTGAKFSKTDFYSWGDSYRASGDKEYGYNSIPENSFAEIYKSNKDEIGKLVDEYNNNEWGIYPKSLEGESLIEAYSNDAKGKPLMRLMELFGYEPSMAAQRANIVHINHLKKTRSERAKKAQSDVEERYTSMIDAEKKALDKWLKKAVNDGKATYITRTTKSIDNFAITKEEVHGRYGWYEPKSYSKGTRYHSGYKFSTKRMFDSYQKRAESIKKLESDRFLESNKALSRVMHEQYGVDNNAPRVEDDAKYQIIGEKGASALDNAQEATYRMDNLSVARQMEEAGKDEKTIRLATGWERGADGKWRYEIMDGKFKKNPNLKEHRDEDSGEIIGYTTKLGELLDNEELFKAYPQLRELRITFQKIGYKEAYFRNNSIHLDLKCLESNEIKQKVLELENSEAFKKWYGVNNNTYSTEEEKDKAWDELEETEVYKEWDKLTEHNYSDIIGKKDLSFIESEKGVLLHEIQHAIQKNEAFSSGGNINRIKDVLVVNKKIREKVEDLLSDFGFDEWIKYADGESIKSSYITGRNFNLGYAFAENVSGITSVERKKLISYLDKANLLLSENNKLFRPELRPFEVYERLAGEVESRNVEARMNMSEQERRETLLADTEDVSRKDQIFLFNNLRESQRAFARAANSVQNDAFNERINSDNRQSDKFSVRANDELEKKSLVGIHNLTDDNLRYAIKLGGLANPSTAVVDTDIMGLEGFGDISMIMPKSLVDKRTGKNVGTYAGDAYTPRFPKGDIVKHISSKGEKKINQDYQGNDRFSRDFREAWHNYGNEYGGITPTLYYMYKLENGGAKIIKAEEPKIKSKAHQRMIDKFGNKEWYELNDAEKQELVDYRRIEIIESLKGADKNMVDKVVKDFIDSADQENLAYKKLRMLKIEYKEQQRAGEVDYMATYRNAQDDVALNGEQADFNKWLADKSSRYGIEDRIFLGYTPSGNRKYAPMTLANISKVMKEQGRAGAEIFMTESPHSLRGKMLPVYKTLEQIKKNKSKLVDTETYEKFRKEISDEYNELILDISKLPNVKYDDTHYILEDALLNGFDYAEKQADVQISDAVRERISAFGNLLKEAPVKYFETKFERPVMLNEFVAAVVPKDIDAELKNALINNGLAIEEYERGNEDSRLEAVKRASNRDDIRFQLRGTPEQKFSDTDSQSKSREAQSMSRRMNVPVRVVDDSEYIFHDNRAEENRRKNSKGFYDSLTGEVVVVAQNNETAGDVVNTIFHETVAHKGLRDIAGEDYHERFIGMAYGSMSDAMRSRINSNAYDAIMDGKYDDWTQAKNSEISKVLSDLSQKDFAEFTEDEIALWKRLREHTMNVIEESSGIADIRGYASLNDTELRYMLWKDNNNVNSSVERDAIDTAMRIEYGLDDDTRYSLNLNPTYKSNRDAVSAIRDEQLPLEDRIAIVSMKLADKQKQSKAIRNDAVKKVAESLESINSAISAQRQHDKLTANRIVALIKEMIAGNFLSNIGKLELKKLFNSVPAAIGERKIESKLEPVFDVLVKNMDEDNESLFNSLISTKAKKVDKRGVEVQGTLDAEGQQMLQALNIAKEQSKDQIEQMISEAQNYISEEENEVLKKDASNRLSGYILALQYARDIRPIKAEIEDLKTQIKILSQETGDAKKNAKAAIKAIKGAIRKLKIQRIEAYRNLIGQLSKEFGESVGRAKEFKEMEKQRVQEIHHNANSDMQGRSHASWVEQNDTLVSKVVNNRAFRILFSPLSSFDQMMRMFGRKSANGEGYLWNRYVRGWVECREKELSGFKEKMNILDEKVKELFPGRKGPNSITDMIKWSENLPKSTVEYWNGERFETRELSQGNLMYIYMANKMIDGRMKLAKMGITDEDVARIKQSLDQRIIQMADWIQEELLPKARVEYNETHKRLFGAPMASIENYFPLKILKTALEQKEEDLDVDNTGAISETTNAFKRRTVNVKPLDIVGTNALNLVVSHLSEMEHINAFGEWNRDLNTLRTYNRFRNQVMNMKSVYGSGEVLWREFNKLCQIAAGTYKPQSAIGGTDSYAVNIAKGYTASRIAFRAFTAAKQLASIIAYLPDVSVSAIAKSAATAYSSFQWSMDNLPLFKERWQTRIAGDPRLLKTEKDWSLWSSKAMELSSKYGMLPNAFVDAVTVAIGAKAIYDTRYKKYFKQYKKSGATDDDAKAMADKKAKQDATIMYNSTQQSNEAIFLSPIQVDRTWHSVMMSIFRNSPFSYTRQTYDAIRNLKRSIFDRGYRKESIEFMTKQLMREQGLELAGVTEEQRNKFSEIAKKNYDSEIRRGLLRLATFGFACSFLWELYSKLPQLTISDDDEQNKEIFRYATTKALFSFNDGLFGGDVQSTALQAFFFGGGTDDALSTIKNSVNKSMPFTEAVTDMFGKLCGERQAEGLSDLISLAVATGTGVDVKTIGDMVYAVMDACGDDIELSKEAMIFIMRVTNTPQSQIDQVYFEEVGMTGKEASKLTPEQLAKRYAEYKVKRGTMLIPSGFVSQKLYDSREQYAYQQIKERYSKRENPDIVEKYMELDKRIDEIGKQKNDAINAISEGKFDSIEKLSEFANSRDYQMYEEFGQFRREFNKLVNFYMKSKSPKEAEYILNAIAGIRKDIATAYNMHNQGNEEMKYNYLQDAEDKFMDFYDEYAQMRPDIVEKSERANAARKALR